MWFCGENHEPKSEDGQQVSRALTCFDGTSWFVTRLARVELNEMSSNSARHKQGLIYNIEIQKEIQNHIFFKKIMILNKKTPYNKTSRAKLIELPRLLKLHEPDLFI